MPIEAYKYYKYAFFSGFTTIATCRQPAEFFKEDIAPIFDSYRNSLAIIQQKAGNTSEKIGSIVYRPVPYCLFGDFDLAVFSLTDDFGFATKEFKPAPDSNGFKYQVNTGIIPLIETYKNDYAILSKFEKTMLPNFFSREDFYPFTGIAMIKLNNAMLMGNGQGFISGMLFFLVSFIDGEIGKLNQEGYQFFYILNESLGWNEITINFFGNSMRQMQELLLSLRSKRLLDILTFLRGGLSDKYDQEKVDTGIIPKLERVKDHSLLADLLQKERSHKDNCLQSHPIIATSITYGFHAELTDPRHEPEEIIDENIKDNHYRDRFRQEYKDKAIHIGWKVKPGHEKAADKLIKQSLDAGHPDSMLYNNTQSGKYTFVYPERQVSIKEYIDFARNVDKDFRNGMLRNIIKFQSRIQWPSIVAYQDFDEALHHNYLYDYFAMDRQLMEEVQEKLSIYPVSHTIKGQIENLIINFNDAVKDPLMYSYFMGLKQSLLSFLRDNFQVGRSGEGEPKPGKKTLDLPPNTTFKEITASRSTFKIETDQLETLPTDTSDAKNILDFVQNWNKAYWNRYFHSYYFTEITDFNIEHHGGIQQILFTYDTMYKLVAKRIYGRDSKGPFVNVQGSPTITSTQYYNSVNINHLFRPAIYACECVHEAANHVIPFLISKKPKKKYSFLFNPSRQVEDEVKAQFRTFDMNIRQHLDARDQYENEYIEHNFGVNTVRQIVTDYFTYRLAYERPGHNDLRYVRFSQNRDAAVRFYHCHWYLFLMNTDLYSWSAAGTGSWFFKEEEFREIFIRFNLMFYLFYKCDLTDLQSLNDKCPSIELKPLWDSRKNMLLQFVKKLGEALKKQFDHALGTKNGWGFQGFHSDLRWILREGWKELEDREKEIYNKVTVINSNLIKAFHRTFNAAGGNNYNIIKRNSKTLSDTNVDFFRNPDGRKIFLDPKGNIFSTSPEMRQRIFEKYIRYIKQLWNYALEISLLTFKVEMERQGEAHRRGGSIQTPKGAYAGND